VQLCAWHAERQPQPVKASTGISAESPSQATGLRGEREGNGEAMSAVARFSEDVDESGQPIWSLALRCGHTGHLWPVLREAAHTKALYHLQAAGEVAAEGSAKTGAEGSGARHLCLPAPQWIERTCDAVRSRKTPVKEHAISNRLSITDAGTLCLDGVALRCECGLYFSLAHARHERKRQPKGRGRNLAPKPW